MKGSQTDVVAAKKLNPGRVINILVRTLHICMMGVLFGGHVFDVSRTQLEFWLYGTIISGVLLVILEAFPHWWWFCQGRGLATLCKLILLCTIPVLWDYRALILCVVVVIASITSHMPARYRYYSFFHKRVMHEEKSPAKG